MLIKKKIFFYSITVAFFSLVLSSCNPDDFSSGESSSSESSIVDTQTTASSFSDSSSVDETPKNFQIIAVNDLHGMVLPASASSFYKMGIQKLATIIKNFKNQETTFVLSGGDMWQGSLESYDNRGAYVTEAMNIIGFDAMTIGNHEFDWGTSYIESNGEIANFPFLGANILDRASGNRASFAKDCVLIEKNGIKLGVIGTIGVDQYSDITYTNVKDLIFDSTFNYVKNCATTLRNQGADYITLLTHESWTDYLNMTEQKRILNECDINSVLSAHSHQYQNTSYNSIPILQARCYGEAYSQIKLTKTGNEVTTNSFLVHDFTSSDYNNTIDDPDVKALYESKYSQTAVNSNEVIGSSTGTMNSTSALGKYAAETGYNYVNESYSSYNIIGFFHNQARAAIYSGNVTNGDIFTSFPFDNEILIMNVKGTVLKSRTTAADGQEELYPLLKQYGVYPFTLSESSISENSYYNIGIIDYLGYKIANQYLGNQTFGTGKYIRDAIIERIKKDKVIDASRYQ